MKAKNKLQQNCLARINHRSMELPLVSLSSQPSGFNSLQIRYVLIVFVFFVLSNALKIRVFIKQPVGLNAILRASVSLSSQPPRFLIRFR